ncbi:hypothetical protein [Companilactobacillus bobalius]|uniref:Uncharacterized protein n=2 Tax=Companilactobacillus bobalius TaxID=2801451 RepID=A0A202FFX5_9LACO|nr:hypothetical protein [Companilactobacillus bobalius]KRK82948.1 hypothetical protein FC78_GL001754 [Companilactobacillus bobalius DSM 19674]OVE99367.1 hypothetical protein LKACC16343_00479 [Companilactobacillus bobalius]GEO57347.1 hypothetical protein LBO01_04760 [Companilactobacillus paralimentarius]
MEIGSLAEWVESFAEILAVSIALFLPYYQKRRANKEKNQQAKQIIIKTSNKLLHQTKIQESLQFEELTKFVSIYLVLATNDTTVTIIQLGDAILNVIGTSDQLSAEQQSQVTKLIDDLNKIKI